MSDPCGTRHGRWLGAGAGGLRVCLARLCGWERRGRGEGVRSGSCDSVGADTEHTMCLPACLPAGLPACLPAPAARLPAFFPLCLPACPCRPREVLLRSEFAAALAVINAGLSPAQQVMYIPWGEAHTSCRVLAAAAACGRFACGRFACGRFACGRFACWWSCCG